MSFYARMDDDGGEDIDMTPAQRKRRGKPRFSRYEQQMQLIEQKEKERELRRIEADFKRQENAVKVDQMRKANQLKANVARGYAERRKFEDDKERLRQQAVDKMIAKKKAILAETKKQRADFEKMKRGFKGEDEEKYRKRFIYEWLKLLEVAYYAHDLVNLLNSNVNEFDKDKLLSIHNLLMQLRGTANLALPIYDTVPGGGLVNELVRDLVPYTLQSPADNIEGTELPFIPINIDDRSSFNIPTAAWEFCQKPRTKFQYGANLGNVWNSLGAGILVGGSTASSLSSPRAVKRPSFASCLCECGNIANEILSKVQGGDLSCIPDGVQRLMVIVKQVPQSPWDVENILFNAQQQ